MQRITLHYRQGSSDKIYQAAVEPAQGGHIVTFAYGRRGSTLSTGTKTQSPVPLADAIAIYEKLVRGKMAKGYTSCADGTPYQHTDMAKQTSGILPQLPNAVDEDDIEALLADPSFWMQEKHDGRRLLLRREGNAITGINKLGLVAGVPEPLARQGNNCSVDFVIDGEAVGDTLHAFDLLLVDGEDLRGLPYAGRHLRLVNLLASFPHPDIRLVGTHFEETAKREAFRLLRSSLREGAVFKRADAPYTAGRPATGGPQLKFKFCASASFIVTEVNAKRSVALSVLAGGSLRPAGSVTIPPNHGIPRPGQIVEVRYLHAFRASGRIFQPVYLGERDDIRPEECTAQQLKFKPEEPAEEPQAA